MIVDLRKKTPTIDFIQHRLNKKKDDIEHRIILSDAVKLNKRAQINPIGNLQIPFGERRRIEYRGGSDFYSDANNVQQWELNRSENLLDFLGVRQIEDAVWKFSFPVLDNNVAQFVGNGEAIEDNSSTCAVKHFEPNRLGAIITYSKELLLSESKDIKGALEDDILGSIYEALQKRMFSTSEATPNGLFKTSTTITDFADLCEMEKECAAKHAENAFYLCSPSAAKALKQMQNNGNSIYQNGHINGRKVIESANVEDCYFILADFSDLMVVRWGSQDILVDDVTMARDGKVRLILNTYFDFDFLKDKYMVGKFDSI